VTIAHHEHEVVSAVVAGDELAIGALVDEHAVTVRRVARVLAGPDGPVDALVQATWAAVAERLGGFDGRLALRAWVLAVLLEQARRADGGDPVARALAQVDETALPPAGLDPASGAWAAPPAPWTAGPITPERLARARQALEELPPALRLVVVLRDVEGLAARDVGTLLGLRPGAQRALLHAARTRVRAALDERPPVPGT